MKDMVCAIKIYIALIILFQSIAGFSQNKEHDEISKEEIVKSKSALFIKMLFDNPKFETGQMHIFNISGVSIIGKRDSPELVEKNLNEIRLSKGAESTKLIEEKIIENKDEASEYVIENLSQDSIIVLEKITENSYRIREFGLIYNKKDDL